MEKKLEKPYFNNLVDGSHKTKCIYEHDNKNCETYGIKWKDCECCLEYTNVKDDLIEYECLHCNTNYPKKVWRKTSWQATFKKTKVKLDLLTDIDVTNGKKMYQRQNMY